MKTQIRLYNWNLTYSVIWKQNVTTTLYTAWKSIPRTSIVKLSLILISLSLSSSLLCCWELSWLHSFLLPCSPPNTARQAQALRPLFEFTESHKPHQNTQTKIFLLTLTLLPNCCRLCLFYISRCLYKLLVIPCVALHSVLPLRPLWLCGQFCRIYTFHTYSQFAPSLASGVGQTMSSDEPKLSHRVRKRVREVKRKARPGRHKMRQCGWLINALP